MTRDERGAASLLVVGLALTLVLTAAVLVVGGRIVVDRRRAAAVADLAALAGAVAAQHRRPACPAAEDIARRNGVDLFTCSLRSDHVRVGAAVSSRLLGRDVRVTARAHAGPVEPAP